MTRNSGSAAAFPEEPSSDTLDSVVFDARLLAKLIAVTARNAIDDLHAGGAFSDAQAPNLNRALRSRIYEVLLAIEAADMDDPFTDYLTDLVGSGEAPLGLRACQPQSNWR